MLFTAQKDVEEEKIKINYINYINYFFALKKNFIYFINTVLTSFLRSNELINQLN